MTAIWPISSADSRDDLPRPIRDFLGRFVARQRRIALGRALGLATGFSLAWLFTQCMADRLLHLSSAARAAWLASNLLSAVAIVAGPLARLFSRRFDPLSAAHQVERSTGRFDQRLLTLTSQTLSPLVHRGSGQLLEAIARDLHPTLDPRQISELIPSRRLRRPWLIAVTALFVLSAAFLNPWIQMPRLLNRALFFWLDLPPVTTTVLEVAPGDAQIIQGRPLVITLRAQRLGDSIPVVSMTADGTAWQYQAMTSAGEDQFTFTIPAVGHDLQYIVQGGDARSPRFNVHVLRVPAVVGFHDRYVYPAYTALPPSESTNTDGLFEALAGSEATITVVSSEPLMSAVLITPQQRIEMKPLSPTEHGCVLPIEHDQKLRLEMRSVRQIDGAGPDTMAIHAIPDLPPVVKFVQPGGDLRLGPRDRLPIAAIADDDYGVTHLAAKVQINQDAPVEFPLTMTGSPRSCQGDGILELAAFNVAFGDLVHLTLIARDGAGHEAAGSEDRFVLIAPRSVDDDARQRLTWLMQSAMLADRAAAEFSDAATQLAGQHPRPAGDSSDDPASIGARQDFAAIGENAALIRQSLLHVVAHSESPAMSNALARWIDLAQKFTGAANRATDMTNAPSQSSLVAQLRGAADRAAQFHRDLLTAAHGQLAQILLADLQDLEVSPSSSAATQPYQRVQAGLHDEITHGAAELAMNPTDAAFPTSLGAIIDQAHQLVAGQTSIDFAKTSDNWSRAMATSRHPDTDLDSRLALAALVESLRPDANLLRANDLQLAGRAAETLTADPSPPGAIQQYPPALADMQRDDELQRRADQPPADQARQIRQAADEARRKMALWAGAARHDTTNPDPSSKALDAAMAANADMARHDYDSAGKSDKEQQAAASTQPQPGDSPTPWDRIRQAMEDARQMDDLQAAQEQLNADAKAPRPSAQDLLQRQQALAEAIDHLAQQRKSSAQQSSASTEAHTDAMASIQAAQKRMEQLQRAIREARQAAHERDQAAARAAAAQQAMNAATQPAAQAAAKSALDQANAQRQSAQSHGDKAASAANPDSASEASRWLKGISPQADKAAEQIDQQLTPAMSQLQKAMQSQSQNNASSADQASSSADKAAQTVSQQLAEAQRALIQQDSLAAARWFAQTAASELASEKPDMHAAASAQHAASAALAQAWHLSTHRAALDRLSQTQSVQSILNDHAPGAGPSVAAPLPDATAAQRQWGRLHDRDPQTVNASVREDDPADYQDALKAYFEALNKQQ